MRTVKNKQSSANAKSVTVRLDIVVNKRMDVYCAETRFSKSLLVNSALNYFVNLPDERKFEVIKDYVLLGKAGKSARKKLVTGG